MNSCVKTGAWLHISDLYAFYRCDAFICGNTFIFQANFSHTGELCLTEAQKMNIEADYIIRPNTAGSHHAGNLFWHGMTKGLLSVHENYVMVPNHTRKYQGFKLPSEVTAAPAEEFASLTPTTSKEHE